MSPTNTFLYKFQNIVELTGAFPTNSLNVKNKEFLENNPIETLLDGIFEDKSFYRRAEENKKRKKFLGYNDLTDEIGNDQCKLKKEKMEELYPSRMETLKCKECQFECYNTAEMSTHLVTTHRGKKRMKVCNNCAYSSDNTWEMDFHCRSRGHKVKKDDSIPCKKCDYMAVNKDDSWVHKKVETTEISRYIIFRQVHIPPEKLFECGDCVWCGDRLDGLRYHSHSQVHQHPSPPIKLLLSPGIVFSLNGTSLES